MCPSRTDMMRRLDRKVQMRRQSSTHTDFTDFFVESRESRKILIHVKVIASGIHKNCLF